jgi:hypothetical protein
MLSGLHVKDRLAPRLFRPAVPLLMELGIAHLELREQVPPFVSAEERARPGDGD